MKTLPDTIFPVDTLPSQGGDLMGMVYDEKKKCWKLRRPYRVAGEKNPRALKATIHGAKRATQAEAMRKWLEFEEQIRNPKGSLTFKDDVEKYIADNPQLKKNILSIINHVKANAGDFHIEGFADQFVSWIEKEKKRTVRDTDRVISKSTIQAYQRYTKLILRHCGHGEAFEGIRIGKRVIRRRPIEPWEMLKLEEVIHSDYPWFYPAFDFARTNPIRPEDQFSLTVEGHFKNSRLVYAPIKTYSKTGLSAYPIIWDHQKQFFDTQVTGLIFARPDGASMMGGDRYYDFIWGRIRDKAGIKDLQFYDLRHHAVAWMRSHGVEDWRIVKAAGWSSTQMLVEYDPDNRHLIDEYDKSLKTVDNCSPACSSESTKVAQTVSKTGF